MARKIGILLGLSFASYLRAEQLEIVAALDLSQTQAAKASNSRTEFAENAQAIGTLISQLPLSSRIVVVGITDRTYTTPKVILDARIGPDGGPFDSKLKKARALVLAEWTRRLANLGPTAPGSDIIGALRLGGEMLSRSHASRKVIAIFSDGQNYDRSLDLESLATIDPARTVKAMAKRQPPPPLTGIECYVLGIGDHGRGRSTEYTLQLQEFYRQFIESAGGKVMQLSTLRDVDSLRRIAGER